jgi:hypothetical protein
MLPGNTIILQRLIGQVLTFLFLIRDYLPVFLPAQTGCFEPRRQGPDRLDGFIDSNSPYANRLQAF